METRLDQETGGGFRTVAWQHKGVEHLACSTPCRAYFFQIMAPLQQLPQFDERT